MIELKFFGRGAGFNPSEGNTNAWFTKGNHLVMLDCGESTFSAVTRNPGLQSWQSITVLLTHLHADHSGSLASLCSYNHYVLKRNVLIIHPMDTVRELLRLQGIGSEVYDHANTFAEDRGFRATALPVRHVPDMKCFAYELSDEDETIYYSGDAAEFSEDTRRKLLDGTYARIYHDVASYASMTHCPIDELIEKVPLSYRKRIYAMHLDSAFEETLLSKGFSVVSTERMGQRP